MVSQPGTATRGSRRRLIGGGVCVVIGVTGLMGSWFRSSDRSMLLDASHVHLVGPAMWSSASHLTLDAQQRSIAVRQMVRVALNGDHGLAELALHIDDTSWTARLTIVGAPAGLIQTGPTTVLINAARFDDNPLLDTTVTLIAAPDTAPNTATNVPNVRFELRPVP